MSLVDFILNLAGLLLWLNLRARRFDPLAQSTPATLAGTLKPAEPRRLRGWPLLAGLMLLLFLRAVLYWQIGSPANWTPKLDLFVVVLSFRNVLFSTMLLFSLLSFLSAIVVFYFWLLCLICLTRELAEPDPIARLMRLHVGRLGRWPWIALLSVLPVGIVLAWLTLHPLLVHCDVSPRTTSIWRLLAQGGLVSLGTVLSLKYLLPPFLFLHLVASYVYLGRSPLWDFVGSVARRLLTPIRWPLLQIGKVDFAPLAGVVVLLLVLHVVPSILRARNLIPWPQ